ncbi:MAG: hypothetical protein ACPG6R_11030 [Aequoribacter sp.]|uniref:hypothetical protein n=1 Tax=Aequoribacter sp. TaxID=2847771 RepID=UPI003C3DC725
MTANFGALYSSVEITSANNVIIFDEGAGDLTATIDVGTYYLHDGLAAQGSLLGAIDNAMDAAGSFWSVGMASSPTDPTALPSVGIEFASTPNATVQWTNPLTTFDPALLGIDGTSDMSTSASQMAKNTLQPSCIWIPDHLVKIDKGERSSRESVTHEGPSGSRNTFSLDIGSRRTRMLAWEWVDADRIFEEDNTADPAATLQNFYEEFISDGRPFKYLRHTSSPKDVAHVVGTYRLLDPTSIRIPERAQIGVAKYSVGPIPIRGDV